MRNYGQSFSENLKALRLQKGLKQTDMANKLEISIMQYQRYEHAQSFPRFNDLIALADFFEVSLDYLVGRGK